jgi:LTXXQ motif family protein
MRRWTLPVVSAVALSLAVPSPADARPRFGPGVVLGAVAGLMLGGFRHSARHHRHKAKHASASHRRVTRGERRHAAGVARAAAVAPLAAGTPQAAADALRGLGGAPMTSATAERSASPERITGIFWPYAAADLADYVLFANGSGRFWTHGYDTMVSAAFTPAGAEDQRALRGRPRATRLSDAAPTAMPLASGDLCQTTLASADANALIERIERAIAPTASQRDALERLQRALAEGIERIKASCPATMPTTVADRLKTIQDRIWAMHDALLTIRLPFEAFYNSLSDEQRQQLQQEEPQPAHMTVDATEGRGRVAADRSAATCAEPAAGTADSIMRTMARATPAREQRASLEAMRMRSAAMAQLVAGSCPSDANLDPMGRFTAATDRLHVMLFAVMSMNPMLQQLHDSLDDKQKAGLIRALRQVRR